MLRNIAVLDQSTINKIAAGEVVERPAAVVKELVENAIDAGANAITIEIKEGGTTFIRITDNGCGIKKEEVPIAFKRHATSKIKTMEDLLCVNSLGFRGEALSSISAVAQVEIVTKAKEELTGSRYLIEGGEEKGFEEIGCPDGTTFLVRNLFYNTPARRKFLKSPTTEAGYIGELAERMAISHPEISFKFVSNNQMKMHTSGNQNVKDIIYHVYGREIAAQLLEVNEKTDLISVTGFICKPVVSRGNRNYMNYFINGRYIKNSLINQAIEDAYHSFMMAHKYPFTALHIQIDQNCLDVNVHPAKMEVRFINGEDIYQILALWIKNTLQNKELIPEVKVSDSSKKEKRKEVVKEPTQAMPEPFEQVRRQQQEERLVKESAPKYITDPLRQVNLTKFEKQSCVTKPELLNSKEVVNENKETLNTIQQLNLFEEKLLSKEAMKKHRMIGQLFSTYWLMELEDKLFIVDQHAAHEKVLYEKTVQAFANKQIFSQMVQPPIILSLSLREMDAIEKNRSFLETYGFEIEPFGGKEYAVSAVPNNLLGLAEKDILLSFIDGLVEEGGKGTPEIILDKVASLSCKAAVKGNHTLTLEEAEQLMEELLQLENPYHCPHGRPTIISMSKYEIEKKFKRIL